MNVQEYKDKLNAIFDRMFEEIKSLGPLTKEAQMVAGIARIEEHS